MTTPISDQPHFFRGESSGVTLWPPPLRREGVGESKRSGLKSRHSRFWLGQSSSVVCEGDMSCRDRLCRAEDRQLGGKPSTEQGDKS